MAFYQMIYTITFFTVFVINHWIAEIIYMAAGLPGKRMHKNCCINPYDIFTKLRHAFPPVIADILFQLTSVLPINIYRTKSVINFTGRKNISIFFTMRDYLTKIIDFICHKAAKITITDI